VVQSKQGSFQLGNSEVKLDLSGVPGGVYVLKVAGENFSLTEKIVKR
jgi:hypothetical protein